MPVDWTDQNQVQQFRTSAMQQPGADSAKLESYIAQKSSGLQDAQQSQIPMIPDSPTALPVEHAPLPPSDQMIPSAPTPVTPTAPMIQNTLPSQDIQKGILPGQARVTQTAGTRNPIESFSGGVSRDTNFSAQMGTPAAVPPGEWQVEAAYNNAPAIGGHRGENLGYGNAVKVRNVDNGDVMIYQHLSSADVQKGQKITGGTIIGKTGSSGNSTGPNLGIEYQDKDGRIREVTRSQYAPYLFAQ